MIRIQNSKQYDLEARTLEFARWVNHYVNGLPRTISNLKNGGQLVDAAGSVGANYIEDNEALSRKDFAMRIKICRKEAKESRYWLILNEPFPKDQKEKEALIQEATEFVKIFHSILEKSK